MVTAAWSASSEARSAMCSHLHKRRNQCLQAYSANPLLVEEHARIESSTAKGGYGRRQIYELVQNGADAILDTVGTRIDLVLTESTLYCANEGNAIDLAGIDAILHSSLSRKRRGEIGRFGLGFKSVLGVSSRPQFFGQTGSFGFDEVWSRSEIRRVVPDADITPVLRLALTLDEAEEFRTDEVLSEMLKWATTVVRLPLLPGTLKLLKEDIRAFPSEFVLFCPHVQQLRLEDRTESWLRVITVRSNGNDLVLEDAGSAKKTTSKSRWRIFSRLHNPSAEARFEAGEVAERDLIPITWAVPLEGRPSTGQFWAFFPTEYETTLSGILNAPWKTNEDRQNLLRGDFNTELLGVAARLIVDSLQEVTPPEQPGGMLDYLPGRLREEKNWADAAINAKVYELAANSRCLPDEKGILRSVSGIRIPPADLPDEALRLWAEHHQRPPGWVHSSCETRERRSRVDRLLSMARAERARLVEWLESLARLNVTSSGVACQIAASLKNASHALQGEVLQASIVWSACGQLFRPQAGRIFFPGPDSQGEGPKLPFVHPTLTNYSPYRAALQTLGITALNARAQFENFLRTTPLKTTEAIRRFWHMAALLSPPEVLSTLRAQRIELGTLRIPTADGGFRRLDEVLLPGQVVEAGTATDVLVDVQILPDLSLVQALGVRSGPSRDYPVFNEAWFSEYRQEVIERFYSELPQGGRRPQQSYLDFVDFTSVGPLSPMRRLDLASNVKFTSLVLNHPLPDWILHHSTREKAYPKVRFTNPSLWFVRKFGAVESSLGPTQVGTAVGSDFKDFGSLMPVAKCSEDATVLLRLPRSWDAVPRPVLHAAYERCLTAHDDVLVAEFYSKTCQLLPDPPNSILCRAKAGLRQLPPNQVVAARNKTEHEDLIAHDIPALLARGGWEQLVECWNLRTPEVALQRAIHPSPQGAPELLCDKYPMLRLWAEDRLGHIQVQFCDAIRIETFTPAGRTESHVDLQYSDDTIFALPSLRPVELLRRVSAQFALELTTAQINNLIEVEQTEERSTRKLQIISVASAEERFMKAVGTSAIRRKLPAALLNAIQADHATALSDSDLYGVAEAVYGVELLKTFREELESAGLQPPVQWAGSTKAKRFVRELGFSQAFAGFQAAQREPLLRVSGPPVLPPLHKFQREIADNVRNLLSGKLGTRALLSLPTGAGKTRVAVQAIVEEIASRALQTPIVWIAQSDELCEQAVQTWRDVWRALGAPLTLSISRFWASNEADPVEAGTHIVVATIDKLRGCINDAAYSWLEQTRCVVVDEAHTAIAPEYTRVLEWLGLTRKGDRCPLLGLTATPFRGRSAEETERLVARYGRQRLDSGVLGDRPYEQLQQMGVLARVRHKLLAGITVDLSADELRQLKELGSIPASVRERIGADVARNRQLVESILSLPPDWPVLLFATSVSHAQTMAALLNLRGVTSAAISAETDPSVRRYYIEEFRRGRLRALTNYGVLTQGFDAPAVRAIFVARPTYSPNVYQQMIGRGLRGPKNGGKEECLILNVADNLVQYGAELAFTQFEYLWS